MTTKYHSSRETTNFARLSRLVIDVCCDLLRSVLQAKIPPSGLTAFLQSQRCQLCKNLERRQRLILYPSGGVFSGTLEDLDFTLLYKLVRNLQGINTPPHQNGWGTPPNNADRSLAANIDRLRVQRNEAYVHLTTASLSDVQFNARWNLIRQSISEIESGTLTGDKYVKSADDLLIISMDPATEQKYIEELEKHYKADLEVKDIALEVKGAVAGVTTKQESMASDIGDIKEIHPKIAALTGAVAEATTKQKSMASDIVDIKGDVTAIKDTLNAIAANTRHIKEIHPKIAVLTDCSVYITQGAVAEVTTKQKSMASDIVDIKEIHPKIAVLTGDVTAIKDTLNAIAANTRHIKEIHPKIAVLTDCSVYITQGAVAEVTTKQKSMASDIVDIKGDVTAIKDTLNAIAANTRHIKEAKPNTTDSGTQTCKRTTTAANYSQIKNYIREKPTGSMCHYQLLCCGCAKKSFVEFRDCSHQMCLKCLNERLEDTIGKTVIVCGVRGCTRKIPICQLEEYRLKHVI